MSLSRGLRRRRARIVTLGLTIGALLLTAAAFAGASGAKSGGAAGASATLAGYPVAKPDQPWAWQKFLAQGTDAVETLGSLGIDVTEGTTKNPDGSAWISVLVTPEQRDYLEALGYRAGDVVETQAQAEAAQAEMVKVGIATMKSRRSVGKAVPHKRGFATETLKVTRADYFQSYSGTWLSVEAKSSAAIGSCQVNPTSGNCGGSNQSGTDPCLGNPAGGASGSTTGACPVLTAHISTDGGATWHLGPNSTMATEVDDDTYLYHRLLIRLSNFAGNATAPTVDQVKVWVTSQYNPPPPSNTPGAASATRPASEFAGTPPNFDAGFQHDFFNRYQTPQDGKAWIEQLAAERPDIAHLVTSPYSSGGYMRPAQASVGCSVATVGGNSSIGGGSPTVGASPAGFATPSSCSSTQQNSAVMLESKAMGNQNGVDIGNAITYQVKDPSPLAPSLPLTISVAANAITVTRATNAAGTVDTTATTGPNTAKAVVAAINADPNASALVTARRFGQSYTFAATPAGNAGNSVVAVNANPVPLSDALFAPQPGNPSFPAGFEPKRAPFNFEFLRICKVCDGSKPGFYVFAEHHAREWVAPLVAMETAGRLVRNYGTDPETTSFVDNLDIFVLPAQNPDGSNYSLLQGGTSQQRKNLARYCGANPGNTTSASWDLGSLRSANVGGVDNNRNYTVGSLFDGYEGASTGCTSEVYAGPSEASEPETQNELWLLNTFPNIRFSMNVHTSGGYFMWSPAAYKTVGRIALPYASKGWQETFWSAAKNVLTRIKQVRGTVVVPARTGPVADVLYSAAGNESDEAWYNHNMIAYDFECGVDVYSATSTTSNTGSSSTIGFQPTFATEGRFEGQEFASGMYGLMTAAVAYAQDVTAPVTSPSVPSGTVSQTPISLVLNESEPSDIYYTTNGSAPTTSSTQYQLSAFREQEGQTLTFPANTTLKWFAVDPKGNTSAIQTATFIVDNVAPVTTASFSPAPGGGFYSNPTVTLTASDDNSGVASTSFTRDGGASTPYTGPLSGFSDGSHTLTFTSTDNAGNVEATKTVTFQVDSTPPSLSSTLTPATPDGLNGWYLSEPTLHVVSGGDTTGAGVAVERISFNGSNCASARLDQTLAALNPGHAEGDFQGTLAQVGATVGPCELSVGGGVNPVTDPEFVPFLLTDLHCVNFLTPTPHFVCSLTWSFHGGVSIDWAARFNATDDPGNTAPTQTVEIKVDLEPPVSTATLTPAIRNGWYASPTLTLSAVDGTGSGIAHIDYSRDGGPWTAYSSALSGFSTGNHFVQYRATDNAGRVEAVRLIAFKADSVKPSVTITAPADGAQIPLDKVTEAKFKCVDNESGLDTCVGTVANGANLDTSTVGDHAFTVTGTDKAGNVTVRTVHYQVVYRFNGFFSPVTNTGDGLNLVHAGDLIKIGFGLDGNRGLTPFAAGFPTSVAIACPSGTPHSVPAGGAGTDPGLSYGVASGHYTYGWQTQTGWAGTCRRFEIQLNDGTSTLHTADFMFFS